MTEGVGDFALQTSVDQQLGQGCFFLGDYRRAVELLAKTAPQSDIVRERFNDFTPPGFNSRNWLARSLCELGRFDEARRHAEEALRIAASIGQPFGLVMAHLSTGQVHASRGAAEDALLALERAFAIARDAPSSFQLPLTAGYLGYVYATVGRTGEGIALLEDALARAAAIGFTGWSEVRRLLGEAYLLAGRRDEAVAAVQRALDISRRLKHRGREAHVLRVLGEIAATSEPADVEGAHGHYREAMTLAEPRGMRPLVAHCHLSLGRLWHRTEQRAPSHEHLSIAMAMYREMDMRSWLEQAEAELRK